MTFTDATIYPHAECETVTYSVVRNTLQEYPAEIQPPIPSFTLRTWANLFIRRDQKVSELIKGTLTFLSRVLSLDEYGYRHPSRRLVHPPTVTVLCHPSVCRKIGREENYLILLFCSHAQTKLRLLRKLRFFLIVIEKSMKVINFINNL